ncbi:MAG: hypothetical protein AB8G96_13965 [Phycisphaerales bacterium]
MRTSRARISGFLTAVISLGLTAGAAAQPVIDVGAGDVIASGTDLPNGATVNVFDGGSIGLGVDLSNGTLNIMGGNVALGATGIPTGFTNSNNEVNVSGGNVGPFFQFFGPSVGTITGGTLATFGVFNGASVTVSGGTVTGFPDVFSSGTVTIEGGTVASFRALAGSQINLVGRSFALGGEAIDIAPGETITLTARNQILTATLADGSFFDHALLAVDPGFPTPDVAVPSATITLTVDPNPTDLDRNGVTDFADILIVLAAFGSSNALADLDADGVVGFSDLLAVLAAFGA